MKQISAMNRIYKDENQDTEECIETLCKYFKENIKEMANIQKTSKESSIYNTDERFLLVHSSLKGKHKSSKESEDPKDLLRDARALSQSNLSSLNVKLLISKIVMNECDQELKRETHSWETMNSCSTNNTVGNLISQNIDVQDEILKLIFIGAKGVGKTRLINNLISSDSISKSNEEKNFTYNPTLGYILY